MKTEGTKSELIIKIEETYGEGPGPSHGTVVEAVSFDGPIEASMCGELHFRFPCPGCGKIIVGRIVREADDQQPAATKPAKGPIS